MNHAFSLIFLLFFNINFNVTGSKVSIYLRDYDYSFTPQKEECIDTLIKRLEDGRQLKITLLDCRGQMHVECFKNKKKVEEGHYVNSLDLLKKYINRIDGTNGTQKIKVYSYYEPLRSGTWFFYDTKGNLLRKQFYNEGVIQK